MDYLIGLDIGTSSIKGVLTAANGKEQYTDKEPFQYRFPQEEWVEMDAEDYLQACCALLRRLGAQLPAGGQLRGICAASASGNLLLLDQGDAPITPIFNWQDHRVTDEVAAVYGADFDGEAHYRKAGWPFSTRGMTPAWLCWLKNHQPEILEQTAKVCMSTEYLFYKLSGQWGVGPSAGTPFHLIDQVKGTYLQDELDLLGIKEAQLPPILKTGALLGEVTAEGAALAGIPQGTPIYIGTFDHPAAARAAGVWQEGQMLLSCGTSWVCFLPIGERNTIAEAKMLIDPYLSEEGGCWAGIGAVSAISAKIEACIRRNIADEGPIFDLFAQEAAKSEAGAGGLRIDLYSDAKIEGWEKRHIARAIMEETIRLLGQKIDTLKPFGICPQEAVMVGGPSECPLWAEVMEEMLGLRVAQARGAYTGALGAAMVAGISAGLYADLNEAAALKGE